MFAHATLTRPSPTTADHVCPCYLCDDNRRTTGAKDVPNGGGKAVTNKSPRLPGSVEKYSPNPSEVVAEQSLITQRWPDGKPKCPVCKSDNPYIFRIKTGRLVFRCRGCRRDFTATSGTPNAYHKKSLDEIANPLLLTYAKRTNGKTEASQLLHLIESIIPRSLPSELRGDAIQEMALGVVSGEVTVDDLQRYRVEMRERFIGRVKKAAGFEEFAISLDSSFDGSRDSPSFYEAVKHHIHNPFANDQDNEDDDLPELELWVPAERYWRMTTNDNRTNIAIKTAEIRLF